MFGRNRDNQTDTVQTWKPLKIYAVRDAKAGVFGHPMFLRSHGDAERTLIEGLRRPDAMIALYPQDYDLYYLGEYFEETGKFELLDTPQHVTKAVMLLDQVPKGPAQPQMPLMMPPVVQQ